VPSRSTPFARILLSGGLALCAILPARASADPILVNDDLAVARVLDLVEARLEVMEPVAASKWLSRSPVQDPAREQAVLDEARSLAVPMGLSPEPVREFFALQIQFGRARQQALHDQWRKSGCTPCAVPPDLELLRGRIDRINRELLDAIYLAVPALARDDFIERARETAGQRLGASLPEASDRQRLLEHLHAIRFARGAGLERVRGSGLLRVGTTADYAPFSVESGGQVQGADVELARGLAAHLGVRPVFVRTSWPALLADLATDRYDVALSGISITPERSARGRFSVPYQSGGKTIVARCAERRRYETLADVDRRKVRVVVNPGGTNERYVREHLRRAQVVLHGDNRTVFDEILAGRADVMITDDVEADLQAWRHPELCRTLPGTLTKADKAAFMVDDPALASAVNEWLQAAIAQGVPARELREAMTH
jgi:cyclohexadienyl dehydratase